MANYELITKVASLRKLSNRFVDFRGVDSEIPIENASLILNAMGYDLNDEHRLKNEAAQLEASQWLNLLEPITVLSPLRGSWSVDVYVNAAWLGESAHWVIRTEGGDTLQQSFDCTALTQTGDYWVGPDQYVRRVLTLPTDLPLGYHRLEVRVGEHEMSSSLIVTPKTSYHSEPMHQGKKIWGTAIQLYTLRTDNNWGIGDFGDLHQLIRDMAAQGADVIGLNPIHALYPISPDHCSPYSPSDRSFLNVLYTDINSVPECAESAALQKKLRSSAFSKQLEELRRSDQVQHADVSALKFECFELLYSAFKEDHLGKGTDRDNAFQAFIENHGVALRHHAVFYALLAHFKQLDINAWGWPVWPDAYKDHHSDAVHQFALDNEDAVNYWTYLQFIADEQLQSADQLAKELGMTIGLYRDLAVGADRGGAEVWGNKESFCLDASIGAPPDALGPNGQNWGLPPLDPIKLKNESYQTFITLLRNNMRACGALRIDHALGLLRLWWCPPGKTAASGGYVYYDMFDMLGILNLESHRNQCMVIAEDLGTVPGEVMEFFPKAELYSNKVFYFEMSDGQCRRPEDYPPKALAIVCNHDMPTVKAYWNKSDLDIRRRLNLFGNDEEFYNESRGREYAKRVILESLARQGFLPEGMSTNPDEVSEMTYELCFAIHKYLAASASQIIAVQLEDMMLVNDPVNIPGTSDEYPNWRRKLTQSSQELFSRDDIKAFCRDLNLLRQ